MCQLLDREVVMARRHKDLNKAAKVARRQGWTIERARRNSHEHWRSPEGALVVVSCSPSDGNAHRQALRDLRKAGLRYD